MVGNKVLRSIYLDLDQIEKIKKLSEKTKVPQAVYVREGLDLLLQKYEEQLRQIIKNNWKTVGLV